MARFRKKEPEVLEPMDLDSVMKKFDRESNTRIWEGKPKIAVTCVLALFSLFCLYVTLFANWLEEWRLTSFVAGIVFLGYMVYPAKKGVQRVNYLPWYDLVLMIAGTGSFLYFTFHAMQIIQQGNQFAWYQILIGIVGILSLAEVCRRSVGLPILVVAGCFMIYALIWGLSNPSFSGRLNYMVRYLFYSKEGILSTPINVCSKYIIVFIIFSAFLERTGIADLFMDLANALVGRFSGGPAKAAVVCSAFEGMVSGSSVANTVGSGSVTIPLMKKTGYSPEFSAAAEASASTGGQIMPPILGAAAFLMADYVGVPYSTVVKCAILPALLYFGGVFISVHLEAKKLGLKGLSKEQIPALKPLLKKLYLLLPLVVLFYLIGSNKASIQYAAAMAIIAAIVVGLLNKENRITPRRILEALAAGAQGTVSVAAACGIAGIIAGTITMTGLANMVVNLIVTLAGNQVIIALVLTMICCIILGMGVPTTANYCIMAATCAPILIRMGVPTIAAHFFVFYFGIVADLTPPVALAAYAGAAIGQANPMKTAITATKLAIAAFIVPYIFALNPSLLLIDTTAWEVISICVTSVTGIVGISAALEGWLITAMPWYQRVISAVGGLLLIYPGMATDCMGIVLVGMAAVLQAAQKRNAGRRMSTAEEPL